MPKTRSQTLCETEKAAVQQHELPNPEADDAVISVGAIDVDQLSCVLEIKTSQEPYFVPPLSNRFEHKDTEVVECKMSHPGMFTDEGGIEDLTASEMTSVACNGTTPFGPSISFNGHEATYFASNGKWLTVMEFFDAVGKHETATRGSSDWFGGVDTHHVFFEGVGKGRGGRYSLYWGS